MSSQQGQLPVKNQNLFILLIQKWLKREPSTIALIRYPSPDDPKVQQASTGVFTELNDVHLYAIETETGLRSGHSHWRHGHNWTVHTHWVTLKHVFSNIQFPHNTDQDHSIIEVVNDGDVLFDEENFVHVAQSIIERSPQMDQISSYQSQRYRVKTHEIIENLYQLETSIKSPDDSALTKLMHNYNQLVQITKKLKEWEQSLESLGTAIGRAGQSRKHFTAALKELRTYAGSLLEWLGGKPPTSWYSPSFKPHLMPPDFHNVEDESDIEETLPQSNRCNICNRPFTES